MKQKGRILGIDYGRARIGLALSDPMQLISNSLTTLRAKGTPEASAPLLAPILEEHFPCLIIVGLPLHMNGSTSEMSDEVLKFIEALKKVTTIPISTLDERLTSMQADRFLKEANLNRKERARKVDALSAQILLQSWLDRPL